MTARASITFAPRLLPVAEAAAYLGISPSKLRELQIPRRMLGGKRVFDRMDLDRFASDLPYEGDDQSKRDEAACDQAFGITP
ncbi:helix-turn-helix domain-containing protein [Pararhodobacter zhoushanensis]|uniref:Helix-turn-helix domain-containing protein n=1 Tax=Pararhodobacter zhoushanensis TaxID=2479545 RepID=A0ABT3GYU0_9RHOB|nr:helix-turn-helix domain-containing protein [Pararhodobacter zhoushanensis]MCW1932653.1 helix-turn-helix domain-containing protein [Pararhodobacter zhoushanensis]